MDISKTAIDWTKAEMLSSSFFILFGGVFVAASIGFWHLGKTDISRAYIVPTLVAGLLLLAIGLGIFVQSYGRVSGFAEAYQANATEFISSELERAKRVLNEYRIAVFRAIPIIVAISAVLLLFMDGPVWRASLITTIAMMSVILTVDTNANARLENYKATLELAKAEG